MGKTIRQENKEYHKYGTNPITHEWEERTYDSDHKQYIPHRHLSKEYQAHGIDYKGMEYNGHKPCKGAKQRLTQELRAKEKQEFRNQLEAEDEEMLIGFDYDKIYFNVKDDEDMTTDEYVSAIYISEDGKYESEDEEICEYAYNTLVKLFNDIKYLDGGCYFIYDQLSVKEVEDIILKNTNWIKKDF